MKGEWKYQIIQKNLKTFIIQRKMKAARIYELNAGLFPNVFLQ